MKHPCIHSAPSDHEAPLYTFSYILTLSLYILLALCYLEFEGARGKIVLIGWKGTGRTWSWCFIQYSAKFITAVHNYNILQCFTCYFKLQCKKCNIFSIEHTQCCTVSILGYCSC